MLDQHCPHTCSASAPTTKSAPASSSPSQASSGSTAFSTRSEAPVAGPQSDVRPPVADAGAHRARLAVSCHEVALLCRRVMSWRNCRPAATDAHSPTLVGHHQGVTAAAALQLKLCVHAERGAAAWWRALRAASTSANTSVKLLASSAGRRASRSAASCAVACAAVSASGTSTARRLLPDPLNPCSAGTHFMHCAGWPACKPSQCRKSSRCAKHMLP